jgi:hypothetical protein
MGRHVEQPPRSVPKKAWAEFTCANLDWSVGHPTYLENFTGCAHGRFRVSFGVRAECALLLRPILESSVALGITRKGGLAMAAQSTDQDWRCIAEQASKEMDPAKLLSLIGELCHALDERKLKPWQRNESRPLAAD